MESLLGTQAHEEALQVREEYRDLRAQQEDGAAKRLQESKEKQHHPDVQSGAAAAGGCAGPTPVTNMPLLVTLGALHCHQLG